MVVLLGAGHVQRTSAQRPRTGSVHPHEPKSFQRQGNSRELSALAMTVSESCGAGAGAVRAPVRRPEWWLRQPCREGRCRGNRCAVRALDGVCPPRAPAAPIPFRPLMLPSPCARGPQPRGAANGQEKSTSAWERRRPAGPASTSSCPEFRAAHSHQSASPPMSPPVARRWHPLLALPAVTIATLVVPPLGAALAFLARWGKAGKAVTVVLATIWFGVLVLASADPKPPSDDAKPAPTTRNPLPGRPRPSPSRQPPPPRPQS